LPKCERACSGKVETAPILPHVEIIIDIDLKAIWTILAIFSKKIVLWETRFNELISIFS